MTKHFALILLISSTLLILSACGFQLRGQLPQLTPFPGPWQLAGVARYSDLSHEITRQLHQAGVSLVTQDGEYILEITERQQDTRLFSVNAANEAVEYELTLSWQFALRQPKKDPTPKPITIRTSRIVYQPQTTRLSSDREVQQLRTDMQRELVTRMLRLLTAAWRHMLLIPLSGLPAPA
jgi:LPS-assembly lipoprotein